MTDIFPRFQILKVIVYFNMGDYSTAKKLLNMLNYKELSPLGKKDYYFMKAHIAFLDSEYQKSMNYYSKCRKHMIMWNYSNDLSLMYSDLYVITGDSQYIQLLEELDIKPLRKNIVTKQIYCEINC